MTPRYLVLDEVRLAYAHTPGHGPTVVFLPGFRSDMNGTKALYLEAICRERGHAYLRFDYQGHGRSSGRFEDGTIGMWCHDACQVMKRACDGPLVLVGSSMGGWIMLLAALALAPRVVGLVGIASAPDFTERLMRQRMLPDVVEKLRREGSVRVLSDYSDELTVITHSLIEEGARHLLLDAPIAIDAPVRLIHGSEDDDVPWSLSVTLMQQLTSRDVRLELIKGGDHRLSSPAHLARIGATLCELLDSL